MCRKYTWLSVGGRVNQVGNCLRALWQYTQGRVVTHLAEDSSNTSSDVVNRFDVRALNLSVRQALRFQQNLSLELNLCLNLNLPLIGL